MSSDSATVPHIIKEGARFHVLSWAGGYDKNGQWAAWCRCSEPRCEINREAQHDPE